jgi:hypothetical protein
VMDEGRIIERGTHEELLAGRGLYYRMARHQMKLGDEDGEEEDLRLPAAEENGQPLATPAAASPEAV